MLHKLNIIYIFLLSTTTVLTLPSQNDYSFRYNIDGSKDYPLTGGGGAITDRWEEKRGDVVRGSYSLLQPDGMIRTVDYEVLKSSPNSRTKNEKEGGFRAVVRYTPGPQRLLSSMTLSDTLAYHSHPIINNKMLYGTDNDIGQPDRIKKSVEMFASLRKELEEGKTKILTSRNLSYKP